MNNPTNPHPLKLNFLTPYAFRTKLYICIGYKLDIRHLTPKGIFDNNTAPHSGFKTYKLSYQVNNEIMSATYRFLINLLK